MSQDSRSTGWTRREALGMLGMGAVAAALPEFASAATPTFPKGAVIRTILKDYAPEELGGGATLFHEHMSFASDFMTRWTGYAAETRAINGPPPAAGAGAAGGRGGGAVAAAAARGGPAAPAARSSCRTPISWRRKCAIAKSEGISCIVDGGHPDMGRDINFLRQHLDEVGDADRGRRRLLHAAVLPERDLDDERGADRAGARQAGRDRSGRRVRRDRIVGRHHRGRAEGVSRRSARRTSRRICRSSRTPAFPGKSALEQLDILEDAGVNPNRIVIGHLGNLVDPQRAGAQGDLPPRRVRRLRSPGRPRRRAAGAAGDGAARGGLRRQPDVLGRYLERRRR